MSRIKSGHCQELPQVKAVPLFSSEPGYIPACYLIIPDITLRTNQFELLHIRTIMPLDWIVNEVNATVRGWVGHFHYRNCSKVMGHGRHHVEERLIKHLRKRHKVRDRKTGYVRFKYRTLYERYGLYKVPTTAVWQRAHAL